MNRQTLLSAYTSCDKFLDRLPESISSPLRSEFDPIKELFLMERPARLCFVVDELSPWKMLLGELLESSSAPQLRDAERRPVWTTVGPKNRSLQLLVISESSGSDAGSSLAEQTPDAIVIVASEHSDRSRLAALTGALLPSLREPASTPQTSILAVVSSESVLPDPASGVLAEFPNVARRFAGLHTIRFGRRIRQDGTLDPLGSRDPSVDLLLENIAAEIPGPARLSFARASRCKAAQREVASSLSKTATTVAGIIGAQPIPLADLPILTSLQIALIAGIAYTSGKPLNPRLALEFTAAAGFNVGAAALFRTGARLATKILPGWGNAIAGAIAAGGTYAVAQAATAFFIDDRHNGHRG